MRCWRSGRWWRFLAGLRAKRRLRTRAGGGFAVAEERRTPSSGTGSALSSDRVALPAVPLARSRRSSLRQASIFTLDRSGWEPVGMCANVVGRDAELRATARFLDSLAGQPQALVLEGEPGIGKTTLWLAAVEQARQRGFRVLLCRPSAAEAQLSYASLADLLADVGDPVLKSLPQPQRRAIDFVLLRAEDRKSTRLNSSHMSISYAVFCLKKKNIPAALRTHGINRYRKSVVQ